MKNQSLVTRRKIRIQNTLALLAIGSVISLAFPASAALEEETPIVGLNAQGLPTLIRVPNRQYTLRLQETVRAYHDSILPVLQQKAMIPAAPQSEKWMLRMVAVGVGVSFQAGAGRARGFRS